MYKIVRIQYRVQHLFGVVYLLHSAETNLHLLSFRLILDRKGYKAPSNFGIPADWMIARGQTLFSCNLTQLLINVKVKVKFALEEATRLSGGVEVYHYSFCNIGASP